MSGRGRRAEAVRSIQECREIHRLWVDYLKAEPDARPAPTERLSDVCGGVTWHEEWMAKYDNVLAVLTAPKRPRTRRRG